jgi:hypothetical protein
MTKKDIDIEFLERLRTEHGYSRKYVSKVLGKDYESYYRVKVYKKAKFNTQDLICLINLYNLNQNDIMKLLGLEV